MTEAPTWQGLASRRCCSAGRTPPSARERTAAARPRCCRPRCGRPSGGYRTLPRSRARSSRPPTAFDPRDREGTRVGTRRRPHTRSTSWAPAAVAGGGNIAYVRIGWLEQNGPAKRDQPELAAASLFALDQPWPPLRLRSCNTRRAMATDAALRTGWVRHVPPASPVVAKPPPRARYGVPARTLDRASFRGDEALPTLLPMLAAPSPTPPPMAARDSLASRQRYRAWDGQPSPLRGRRLGGGAVSRGDLARARRGLDSPPRAYQSCSATTPNTRYLRRLPESARAHAATPVRPPYLHPRAHTVGRSARPAVDGWPQLPLLGRKPKLPFGRELGPRRSVFEPARAAGPGRRSCS